MAEYDKVVFIKHAVETLGYFSKQMAETFRKEGFAICLWIMRIYLRHWGGCENLSSRAERCL